MTLEDSRAPNGSWSLATTLLVVEAAASILVGQILLQGYTARPAYEFILPTIGGLLLLGVALGDSLFDRLPRRLAARVAPLRRWLDPRSSRGPLYLAGLVAALDAALIAGDDLILRLPALSLGFWLFGIVIVLVAASAITRPSSRLRRWELLGLALIVAVAGAARLIRLGEIPWLLTGDEASFGLSARELLDGVWTNPFRVAWYSFPSLFYALPAASIRLLGQTIEALRLPAAIAGILTVAALYLYARAAFGRTLAIFSAAYLALFHFHIHFSRIALNNIWDALFLTVFSLLLWRAWTEERPSLFAWAGVTAGLSQYFYTSARMLVLLVPLWMALAWWSDRAKFRRIAANWLVLLAAATVVVLPLAFYFARHPDEFTAPMVRVSILGPWLTREVASTGLPAWRILLDRLGESAAAFTITPLRHWYVTDHPMLLPLPASLFLIGLVLALSRARDLRYAWILMWVAAGVAVGALSESTPAAQRYIFLAPPIALLVALPLAELATRAPLPTPRHRAVLTAGCGAVILLAGALDLRFYFHDYTPSRRFSDINTEVAQNLAQFLIAEDLAGGTQVFFSGQPRMGYASIETLPYLVPKDTFTDVLQPLTAPPTWTVQRPAVFVFLPENLGDLAWVQAAYPGGETIVRPSAEANDLYTVYLLR
jgi:4-amino-4-deoxy-L-arabinose transferase-like glycosyltransferase